MKKRANASSGNLSTGMTYVSGQITIKQIFSMISNAGSCVCSRFSGLLSSQIEFLAVLYMSTEFSLSSSVSCSLYSKVTKEIRDKLKSVFLLLKQRLLMITVLYLPFSSQSSLLLNLNLRLSLLNRLSVLLINSLELLGDKSPEVLS